MYTVKRIPGKKLSDTRWEILGPGAPEKPIASAAIANLIRGHLEDAAAELLRLKWLSIESVPKDGTEVLLDHTRHGVMLGNWDNGIWRVRSHAMTGSAFEDEVTHWMPKPESPVTYTEAAQHDAVGRAKDDA